MNPHFLLKLVRVEKFSLFVCTWMILFLLGMILPLVGFDMTDLEMLHYFCNLLLEEVCTIDFRQVQMKN